MTIFLAIATLVACAVLNRVRGGGFGAERLPGRPLLWVAPAIAGIAWIWIPWQAALAFGAGYLLWGLFSWGYILGALGGYSPDRSPSTLETALMVPGSIVLATFARMMFIAPGLMGVGALIGEPSYLIFAPIFSIFAVAIYAFRLNPLTDDSWQDAEILTGGLIGALIVIAGVVAP